MAGKALQRVCTCPQDRSALRCRPRQHPRGATAWHAPHDGHGVFRQRQRLWGGPRPALQKCLERGDVAGHCEETVGVDVCACGGKGPRKKGPQEKGHGAVCGSRSTAAWGRSVAGTSRPVPVPEKRAKQALPQGNGRVGRRGEGSRGCLWHSPQQARSTAVMRGPSWLPAFISPARAGSTAAPSSAIIMACGAEGRSAQGRWQLLTS